MESQAKDEFINSLKKNIEGRLKKKGTGYLLLDHTRYSILPAEPFGRNAYQTGQEALEIYQNSGAIEAVASEEAAFAAILGAGFLAIIDSYRRFLNLHENYQKGALESMLDEDFDTELEEEELDKLYKQLTEEE